MRRSAVILLVAIVAGACTGTADDWTDPDGVLFRVESEGGFAPVEWLLGRGPVYTLTVDGRLISEGAVAAIFPGPLMPFYQVTHLTDGEMRQMRDMIDRMGLPGMTDERDDSNADFVADATTETIIYRDRNGTHRYSVYALGLADGDQRRETEVFAELMTALGDLVAIRGADPYAPERFRIIVGEAVPNAELPDLRPWPLPATDFSDWVEIDQQWSCKVFEDAERFLDATQVTTWETPTPGDGPPELRLLVRGLHPGEEDCPTAA
jgi:hypothetical protein